MFRKYYLFTIILLSTFALAKPEQMIPIENFVKDLEYQEAVLSPDGKYIAVQRSAEEGKTVVAVIRTKDLKLMSHIPATTGSSPIQPFWANNKRLIVGFTEEWSRLEAEIPNGELLAMDFNGRMKRKIIEHQVGVTMGKSKRLNALHGVAEVVHRLPKEEDRVLISFREWDRKLSTIATLYSINIKNGKLRLVTKAPSHRSVFTFDKNGEPKYCWGKSNSTKKDSGNSNVVHKYVDGEWEELENIKIEFDFVGIESTTDNPSEVIVRTGHYDKPDRLHRYNLDTGDSKLIFAHKKVDPWETDHDTESGNLVAVHFHDGYPNLHLVDHNHLYSKWYPALYQAFGGKQVRITSASDDGQQLIVKVSGANDPGQFRLFNTKTKEFKYLFQAASWIDNEKLAETKPVTVTARDNTEIPGYLTRPNTTETNGKHPLVVLVHGGPRARDYWRYNNDVQFLASRGYAVLQVNYRGSIGYGDGYKLAGNKKWGSLIQHDIIDSTKWAASQDYIDENKICIMGYSFGGYSSLMSPIIEPALFNCALGIAGVYDLNLMWKTGDIEETKFGENYLYQAISEDEKILNKFSPAKRASELKIPIFLAHGEKDVRVDVKHYEVMLEELDKNKNPAETLLFKKEGHSFSDEKNIIELFKQIEKFLAKNIDKKI